MEKLLVFIVLRKVLYTLYFVLFSYASCMSATQWPSWCSRQEARPPQGRCPSLVRAFNSVQIRGMFVYHSNLSKNAAVYL